MADIELAIKIPEEIYDRYMNYTENYVDFMFFGTEERVVRAIRNGTPLPKGHGRLKDIDKIISDGRSKGFCDWYDEMKYADTIIESDKIESEG